MEDRDPGEIRSPHRRLAEVEGGVAMATAPRVIVAIAVMGLSAALALLPALVALGIAAGWVARAAVGLGSLVAVWGGGKVAAAILGAWRFAATPPGRVHKPPSTDR